MDEIEKMIENEFRKAGKSKYLLKIWFDDDPDITQYEFFAESEDVARECADDSLYSELLGRAQEKERLGKCHSKLYKEGKEIPYD